MFLPQNYALLCMEKHIAYLSRSLSLTDAQFAHTLTYTLMLLATLTIL